MTSGAYISTGKGGGSSRSRSNSKVFNSKDKPKVAKPPKVSKPSKVKPPKVVVVAAPRASSRTAKIAREKSSKSYDQGKGRKNGEGKANEGALGDKRTTEGEKEDSSAKAVANPSSSSSSRPVITKSRSGRDKETADVEMEDVKAMMAPRLGWRRSANLSPQGVRDEDDPEDDKKNGSQANTSFMPSRRVSARSSKGSRGSDGGGGGVWGAADLTKKYARAPDHHEEVLTPTGRGRRAGTTVGDSDGEDDDSLEQRACRGKECSCPSRSLVKPSKAPPPREDDRPLQDAEAEWEEDSRPPPTDGEVIEDEDGVSEAGNVAGKKAATTNNPRTSKLIKASTISADSTGKAGSFAGDKTSIARRIATTSGTPNSSDNSTPLGSAGGGRYASSATVAVAALAVNVEGGGYDIADGARTSRGTPGRSRSCGSPQTPPRDAVTVTTTGGVGSGDSKREKDSASESRTEETDASTFLPRTAKSSLTKKDRRHKKKEYKKERKKNVHEGHKEERKDHAKNADFMDTDETEKVSGDVSRNRSGSVGRGQVGGDSRERSRKRKEVDGREEKKAAVEEPKTEDEDGEEEFRGWGVGGGRGGGAGGRGVFGVDHAGGWRNRRKKRKVVEDEDDQEEAFIARLCGKGLVAAGAPAKAIMIDRVQTPAQKAKATEVSGDGGDGGSGGKRAVRAHVCICKCFVCIKLLVTRIPSLSFRATRISVFRFCVCIHLCMCFCFCFEG